MLAYVCLCEYGLQLIVRETSSYTSSAELTVHVFCVRNSQDALPFPLVCAVNTGCRILCCLCVCVVLMLFCVVCFVC